MDVGVVKPLEHFETGLLEDSISVAAPFRPTILDLK